MLRFLILLNTMLFRFNSSLLILFLSLHLSLFAERNDTLAIHDLRAGDLLFAATTQGNAITEVTTGSYDHVAIFFIHKQRPAVLEAISRGVVITPLDRFLRRYAQQGGYGHIAVGRVQEANVRRSLRNARRYLGRPYDFVYYPDNRAIYCSELVQQNFVHRDGSYVFAPIPMSFHDESGRITDYWKNYYRQRGLDVPEGKAGSNPNQLARHEAVRFIGILPLLQNAFREEKSQV